jgi:beta-galactosidase
MEAGMDRGKKRVIAFAAAVVLLASLGAAGQEPLPVPGAVVFPPLPKSVAGIASPVLSLNGTWSFDPAPPKNFESLREPVKGWSPIEVPGDWTMQGSTVKPWTPAGYLKTVVIPADWRGSQIFLRSDGAQSQVTFWVNGRLAGKHEGGFRAFMLDVTALCRPGQANMIAAAVQNESMADVLASGTQYASYQFGGLTRKVTLFAVPALHIDDMDVTSDVAEDGRSAAFKVKVGVEAAPIGAAGGDPARGEVRCTLADPAGRVVFTGTRPFSRPGPSEPMTVSFEGTVGNAALWDPEHPNLHTLTVDLAAGGRTIETVVHRVGLRDIEIAGTRLFVNGRPVKLRGINRHEAHPLRGRSLTPELWRKDAELYRAANINHIRTSHYPPAEEFLDACDELGLFVECEAPLVWVQHGANETWKTEDPRDPKFLEPITRAVAETIAFNRRHPSVIIWSLANESGWSPLFAAANALAKAMDPARPRTFHDQAYGGYNNLGSAEMPIANYHYPGPQGPDLAVSLGLTRPLYYGEYCHLNCYNRSELAADPGVRDEYGRGFERMWEKIRGSKDVIGGSIWSGIDDVFLLPSGKATGYGEWGLIDGWRREKPEYWHIKKSYSPVRIGPAKVAAPGPGEPIVLAVENRHDFTDLRECRIDWRIGGETGRATLELPPHATGMLRIRPKTAGLGGKVLSLEITDGRGVLVDRENIAIGDVLQPAPPVRPFAAAKDAPLEVREDAAGIAVAGSGFAWTFDRGTGRVLRAEVDGSPVLCGGPALMLLPQTSGPCVTDFRPDVEPFNSPCTGWTAESVAVAREGQAVTVTVKGSYMEAAGGYAVKIRSSGQAEFSYEFKLKAKVDPRQYGLVVYLPRSFDTLNWSRKGQWTAYPENHIGRPLGTARAQTPGHEAIFRKPPAWDWKDDENRLGSNDFRSTKMNVLWAVLSRPGGDGLMLVSDGQQACRAFLDGDRVGWLVADFSTGGGDIFFAPHHKMDDRPLEAGQTIHGSFRLVAVSASR